MMEEAGQAIWLATETDKSAADLVAKLGHRGRSGVEQLLLDGAIAQLLRVQLGSIGGQPFQTVVCRMCRDVVLHQPRAVRRQVVPEQQQRLPGAASEILQGVLDLRRADAAEEMAGVETRRSVQGRDQGNDAGHLATLAHPAEDRGVAHRRPSRAYAGPQRLTRFVHEGKRTPCAASPLFTRGQSCLSQASTSASSRSRARGSGRWGLQPRACSAGLREQ
jgi:hypothetical protein